jgi:hypothetical protein
LNNKRSKNMQKRVRRPIAVVVVWLLLGALTAGAALAVNSSGTLGVDMAGSGRGVGSIEEITALARPHGSTEVASVIEDGKIQQFGTDNHAVVVARWHKDFLHLRELSEQ